MHRVARVMLWGVLGLLAASSLQAAVINVEFKFTPFVGDPAKADKVETVAGNARVFLNNIFLVEQPVRQDKVPVMFDAREVAPAVWLPVASVGPALRKGRNRIRIEFQPNDGKLAYRAQLRWAAVNDSATEERGQGSVKATNQSAEGVEDKPAKGALVMEREFDADFAIEQPWHRYPPVKEVSDADRKALQALVKTRAETFKPTFDAVYKILAANPQIRVEDVKRLKCLDKVYAAGLRIAAPAPESLDIALSGAAEVVLRRKGSDQLFQPNNPALIGKLKDEDTQMCAGFALYTAYPPKLVAVRNPQGAWEVAY